MSEILELAVEVRTDISKGATKAYRSNGQTPAVIYGQNKESMLVAVDSKALNLAYNKVGFKSKLIELKLNNGKKQQVMVRDLQVHPVTDIIEHVDFGFVDNKAQNKVLVSLKFTNQEKSIGLKRGGKLNIILREIYVECLAKDSPRLIEVDLGQLNIGQKVKESDLQLPKGVKLYSNKNRIILTLNGKNKKEEAAEGEQAAAAPSKK